MLRRVLSPAAGQDERWLTARRDVVGLAPEQPVELDVQTVREAFTLSQDPSALPTRRLIARLRAATELYRGDFLDGFSLSDAPAFDDWVALQRETWHRRVGVLFDRLSEELFDGGSLSDAIETTERWIALDPLDEDAHRRLIRLRFASGDRAGALRAYGACRTVLAAQLDAAPTPETTALAERVRADAPPAVESRRGEPDAARPAVEGPLVGRLIEHAHLAAAYRAARRGRPRAVALEGEPGIGKTRLAGAFLHWAAAHGADVLEARAFQAHAPLPYQPLVDALRRRLARENAPDDLLGDVWLAELSRLLPELRERYPDLSAPTGDDATAQPRLLEAVGRLVHALAARAPVVLLLDDVQWTDAASRDALRYAARRWAAVGAPVLLLLCLRSEELGRTPALAEWLAGLGSELPLTRLPLEPLSREDAGRLLRGLIGRGDRREDGAGDGRNRGSWTGELDALCQWLFAETGGQPFFLVETVKSLIERGVLRPSREGWTLASRESLDEARRRGPVAPGVQTLLRERFARLTPNGRAALYAAAVLGHGFAFEPLYRVAGVGEDGALTGLDELVAAHLVREAPPGYLFGHDKIREVAYAAAGQARRRLFHRRALDALEASGAPSSELARHALAAGLADRAFGASIAAGDQAMGLFAARDAIGHYQRARELAESGTVRVDQAELRQLYLQLGRSHELTAEHASARAVYEALLAAARDAGDQRGECAALNRLANLAATDLFDFDVQASLLATALSVATASGDLAGLAETEWNLARLGVFRLDLNGAREHAARALALARELVLPEPAARSLNWMALTEFLLGRYPDAQRHAEEARAAYAALGDPVMEADSLAILAGARIRHGQPRAGVADGSTARAIAIRLDNQAGQANAAKELALGLLDCGDFAEALEVAQAGVTAARAVGSALLLILNLTRLGSAQRRLGAPSAARAAHAEAWSICEQVRYPVFTELVAAELCADCGAAGEWEEACRHARDALAARSHPALDAGFTRWWETEALLRAGEADLAAADLARFGERIQGNRRYRVAHLRALAALSAWRGDHGRAVRELEEARRLAETIGLTGELWELHAAAAELHRSRGDGIAAEQEDAAAARMLRSLAAKIADPGLRASFLAAAGWADEPDSGG